MVISSHGRDSEVAMTTRGGEHAQVELEGSSNRCNDDGVDVRADRGTGLQSSCDSTRDQLEGDPGRRRPALGRCMTYNPSGSRVCTTQAARAIIEQQRIEQGSKHANRS